MRFVAPPGSGTAWHEGKREYSCRKFPVAIGDLFIIERGNIQFTVCLIKVNACYVVYIIIMRISWLLLDRRDDYKT